MGGPRQPVAKGTLALLGEYQGLLFVDKPAGLQTEPDVRQADSLVTRVALQFGLSRERLHALSRLDTGVSGVVTLGLTSEARRLVNIWREQGSFRRRYVAVATGDVALGGGAWREPIGRGPRQLRSISGRDPEPAHTDYLLLAVTPRDEHAKPTDFGLLALAPRTGRTHQLRVHASAHRLPLVGDRAYGGVTRVVSASGQVKSFDRVALHAAWVELPLREPLRFSSPMPTALTELWVGAGGKASAFDQATRAVLG